MSEATRQAKQRPEEATAVIADACRRWLDGHPGAIDEVRLVGYDTATVAAFEKAVS